MQNVYLAPNGQPSNLTEEQWHLVRTKAFKDWFGDWENDPENASKIVDANGEPKVMYHQTTTETKNVLLEKGIFQKGYELAAKNDKDTPYGFYFKSTDKDIGLRGKEQMAFFLNARNPLTFSSRYYINTYFNGVTDEFWRLNTEYREMDMSYKKEFDENFKKNFDRKDEKAYQEWSDKVDNILAEWSKSVDDISVRLKEIITNYMLESEYDCMIIELDEGSMGRSTDTAIVFYSNQIKLADGSNTTFDGSNPDIRYAEGGMTDNIIIGIAKDVVKDIGEVYDRNDSIGKCKEISEAIADRLNIAGIEAVAMRIIDGKDTKYGSTVINHAYVFLPLTHQIVDTQLWQVDGTPTDIQTRKVLFDYDEYNSIVELYDVEPISEFDSRTKDIYGKGGKTDTLLAPNGKPSNLTHEQWHLVRTPAFKAWFGDWENNPQEASKVVDENGEPKVVFHGTRADFTVFDKDKVSKNNKWGHGFYFTDNYEYAKGYANSRFSTTKHREPMMVFINVRDIYDIHTSKDRTEYVVKEPTDIKLADGTNTTFDGSNPDIRFAAGGLIHSLKRIMPKTILKASDIPF